MFYEYWFFYSVYTLLLILMPIYRIFITARFFCFLNATCLFFFSIISIFILLGASFDDLSCDFFFESKSYMEHTIAQDANFKLSPLSLYFSLLVSLIGMSTNIYSLYYFQFERDEISFLWILNFFVASMIFLCLANNFFTLFLGWELIGFFSFLLINFWRAKTSALKSGLKAFTFNLVSDVFILGSFCCFYLSTNTTNCSTFLEGLTLLSFQDNFYLWYGTLFLIFGSSIKSVQILSHLWLPDSMEAPVPASALIHSATLVSAGIYLVVKFHPLIMGFNLIWLLTFIGAFTAAYGGLCAATQTDLKKLLAYSTMSHCGFMWFLASHGNLYPLVVYLYIHGFLKAVSFFCASSFIRSYNSQDCRWMGSGHIFLRLDSFFFIFSSMSLSGLPFTIGFFYKHFFLKSMLLSTASSYSTGLLLIGMLCSLVYFYKLINFGIFDHFKAQTNLLQGTLSQTKISFSEVYKQTTNNHILAVCLNYLFIIITCVFFSYIMKYICIAVDDWNTCCNQTNDMLDLNKPYEVYLYIFYILYIIVLVLIIIIPYRRGVFFLESFISFLLICIVSLLFLICEVISWQMLVLLLILISVFQRINRIFWFTYHNGNIDDDFDFPCFELCIFILSWEL